jgi:hypothetical protein
MFFNQMNFPKWSRTFMNWLSCVLFYCFLFAAEYLVINGTGLDHASCKYAVYAVLCLLSVGLILWQRQRIREGYLKLTAKLKPLSRSKMMLILLAVLILGRVLCQQFWAFDSLQDGDIRIYSDIAHQLAATGKTSYSGEYPHLLAIGLYLSVFLRLHIGLSTGIFILFSIGTILNFLTIQRLIGKENAFFATLMYLLMPSTALYTFCVTHELLFYFFLSLILYLLIGFDGSGKPLSVKIILYVLLIAALSLCYFIGMMTPVLLVTFLLMTLFSRKKNLEKILMAGIIPLCLLINSYGRHLMNDTLLEKPASGEIPVVYTLLVGASWEADGRYNKDYIPLVREYMAAEGMADTESNNISAAYHVLGEKYQYLLQHPGTLLPLLGKKFFIAWSGNHYSVELAEYYRGLVYPQGEVHRVSTVLLGLSEMIYGLMILLGIVFLKPGARTRQEMYLPKILLFGVVLVLLIVEIMNKYSSYMTLFLFLIAVSSAAETAAPETADGQADAAR